jgi:hypothetical protein
MMIVGQHFGQKVNLQGLRLKTKRCVKSCKKYNAENLLVDDQFVGDDYNCLHKLQYFQAASHQSLVGSVPQQCNHLLILLGGR